MRQSGNHKDFNELSDEQRRQLVDARQVFDAYRESRRTWDHSYVGSMRWVTRKGIAYLHWKRGKQERSLGRRSAETETRYSTFIGGREELKARLEQLSRRLDRMAPVNRALDLGRVPTIAARIMRRLEEEGLLGSHLLVIGTNALFAFEANAGVLFGAELLATGDADLLWDARQGIELLAPTVRRDGIIGLIQKIDHSFQPRAAGDFRAINADGYYIDLVRPEDEEAMRGGRATIGDRPDDLRPAPIHGLEWLVSAPRFEAVTMGGDGYPVRLVTPDPRAFVLHKLWVADRSDRDPLKRSRDKSQATAVADLCHRYLRLPFDDEELQALPEHLRALASKVPRPADGDDGTPEPQW
jgi:hypothetical protein